MKKLLYSFSFLLVFVYLVSCTKIRTTELGGSLIPAVDNLSVFDTTLEVISEFYQLPDSTRIPASADHAVGIMNDPSFGTTTGEAYLQLMGAAPNTYPFGISPDSIIGLDSLVLSLRFTSLYGDSNSVQSFHIYEIAQNSGFRDSSLGYLINTPSFDVAEEVGARDVNFNTLNDSLLYLKLKDTVKTVNELRITLSNSFGAKLMAMDTSIYRKDSLYKENFKGIAIKTDQGANDKRALAYFNLRDAATHLTFYYRKIKNGVPDTTSTEFIQRTTATANLVKREISGTPYEAKLQNGATNQEELYFQTSPGSYALLKIPGLQDLNNRLIYRAVLTTDRIAGQEDNYFTPPIKLFLDAVDSTNNKFITIPNQFVPDLSTGTYDANTFGGYLKNNRYEFELAEYVQGIVTKKEKSYALRLYAPYRTVPYLYNADNYPLPLIINSPIAAGRVIVAGGANPVKKLRLYIIYSKI